MEGINLVGSCCELNKYTGLVYGVAWERAVSALLRVLRSSSGMRGRNRKEQVFAGPVSLPKLSHSETLAFQQERFMHLFSASTPVLLFDNYNSYSNFPQDLHDALNNFRLSLHLLVDVLPILC